MIFLARYGKRQLEVCNTLLNTHDAQNRVEQSADFEEEFFAVTDELIYAMLLEAHKPLVKNADEEYRKYLRQKAYLDHLKFEPLEEETDSSDANQNSSVVQETTIDVQQNKININTEDNSYYFSPLKTSAIDIEIIKNSLEILDKAQDRSDISFEFFNNVLKKLLQAQDLHQFESLYATLYEKIKNQAFEKFSDEDKDFFEFLQNDAKNLNKIYEILLDANKLTKFKDFSSIFKKNKELFQVFQKALDQIKENFKNTIQSQQTLLVPDFLLNTFNQFDDSQKMELSQLIQDNQKAQKYVQEIIDLGFDSQFDFETLKNQLTSLSSKAFKPTQLNF